MKHHKVTQLRYSLSRISNSLLMLMSSTVDLFICIPLLRNHKRTYDTKVLVMKNRDIYKIIRGILGEKYPGSF